MRRALHVALLAAVALLAGLLVGACGGSSHTTTVVRQAAVTSPLTQAGIVCSPLQGPPAGLGYMGACAPKPRQVFPGGKTVPLTTAVPPGCKFPDVSSWQGNVGWSSVKHWQLSHGCPAGGIFKMGEYGIDPYAAQNNAALRSLGMYRVGYWFTRNTGCRSEANQIIAEAKVLGLLWVAEDNETSEAAGYDRCLTPLLVQAGLKVLEYTSPGAYPGGNGGPGNLAWMAAYGPSRAPAAPWGGRVVAWQCTDGTYGCVTSVPGISGTDDVSLDLGLSDVLKPAPPDPYAKYPKAVRNFDNGVKASEYNTVKTWDQAKCKNPVRRTVCKTSRAHLVLLLGRINFLAGHKLVHGHWVVVSPPNWKANQLGSRAAGIRGRVG